MKKIPFIVLLIFLFPPMVWAQSLGKDVRSQIFGQKDFINDVLKSHSSGTSNAVEEENKLVSQQLEIITGDSLTLAWYHYNKD